MNWQEVFAYRDGKLYWRIRPANRVQIGDEAGSPIRTGHLQVHYQSKKYMAHRIIWEIHNCKIPDGYEIDHINGVRYDNRFDNLRLASRSENMRNSCKPQNNTSGLKGVGWNKKNQKWTAYIMVFGKLKHLGLFPTKEAAYAARLAAEKELHGEFAATEERKELVTV